MNVKIELSDKQVELVVYKDLVDSLRIHREFAGEDSLTKALEEVIDYYSTKELKESE